MEFSQREIREENLKGSNNKKKAFIAGPIHGMEDNQSYRTDLRKILEECGYVVFDPWQREKVLYSQENEQEFPGKSNIAGFIKRDLRDIELCDIFVAYLPIISAGSCMELFYAKQFNKTTIAIISLKDPSPWIIYHSDFILKNIKDFEEFMKKRKEL
ncbi:nucleoside 2-deoxyribosyltransferase [[Eubacterium] cellulosolvens]